MRVRELMDIAVKAGEILLISGAEIYRVEDTITRIFGAYGIECECFVLLSGIFLSVEGENGEVITTVKRIKENTIDLQRIELINSFSRELQERQLDYEAAKKQLEDIESKPRYGFFKRLAFAGATAFVYSLLFKGSITEGLAAFTICLVIFSVKELLTKAGFFQFLEYFVSGVIVGVLSYGASKLVPGVNMYKIIIGAIMFLVPGVAITNGIKDALYGDIVSSLYRIAEAIFISVAVGAGVGLALAAGLSIK